MRHFFKNDMVNDEKRYDTINEKNKRYDKCDNVLKTIW